MNTESIKCRRVESGKIERAGDFCFDDERETIYLWMPGMTGPDAISIEVGKQGGERVWAWDGDEENPTLTPSLHVPGTWHGFLRRGMLESC